jgi:hypothetical protein
MQLLVGRLFPPPVKYLITHAYTNKWDAIAAFFRDYMKYQRCLVDIPRHLCAKQSAPLHIYLCKIFLDKVCKCLMPLHLFARRFVAPFAANLLIT